MKKYQLSVTALCIGICLFSVACQESSNFSYDQTEIALPESSITEQNTINLPEYDFKGTDFTFLGTGAGRNSGYYETNDIYVETADGDIFNDAVFERNQKVEEHYNIKIKLIKSDDIINDVQRSVAALDLAYDAVFGFQSDLYALASGGYLACLDNIPNLDLTNEWWDQNSVEQFRFGGKSYFVTGDISTLDDACTRLCLFNKKLIEDNQLPSPYDYVNSGEWTLDKFSEMTRSISQDLNGNGSMEAGDLFGFMGENSQPNVMFIGAGGKYLEPSGSTFNICITSEENINRFDKIFEILLDKSCVINVNTFKNIGSYPNVYAYGRSLFCQDKFLFHNGCPLVFDEFRDMESDFGIVPLPKFDAAQDRYYCYVDSQSPMLTICATTSDFEMSGTVLEYMAMVSREIVTPAYNEIVLKRKYSRDNESAVMLDIIAESRYYNLVEATGWGNLSSVCQVKYANGAGVSVSDYTALIPAAEKSMENDLANFASEIDAD